MIPNKLRNLLPSFMFILLITLMPNLFKPEVPFPALYSTLFRRRLQVEPVILLIPIDIPPPLVEEINDARYPVIKWLLWGVIFTACTIFIFHFSPQLMQGLVFHQLHRFFFFSFFDCLSRKRKRTKKDYAGSESLSPYLLKKRSHFGTEYRKAPPPREGRKHQWGSGGLQAWSEIGS